MDNEFRATDDFLRAIGEGYWEWDIPGNLLCYSREFISLLGYDENFPSQVDTSVLKDYIYPYDYHRFSVAINDYSDRKTDVFSSDFRIKCHDGIDRWFRARGKAVSWASSSSPIKMIGTLVNIDADKNLEISMSQNQNRFQAIVEDETVMVCRFTREGKLTFVNRTLSEFLGFNENRLIGASIYSHIHEGDRTAISSLVNSFTSASVVEDFECRVKCHNGKYRWLRWRNHLLIDPILNQIEFQAVGQDVTEIHDSLQSYHSRTEFDRVMVHLIGRISGYQQKELNKIISLTLADLGSLLKVDRAHLFLFDQARESMLSTFEWCSEGVESVNEMLQDLQFAKYPWWSNKIKKAEPIILENVNDLVGRADSEHGLLLKQGVITVCAVPLQTQGNVIGFISFEQIKNVHPWLEYIVVLLAILAEAIANAIEGNKASNLIAINEARERLFIDAIPALIVRIDRQGRVLNHAVGCHGTLSQYVAFHAPAEVKSLDDLFERSISDQIFKRLASKQEFQKNKDFEFEITVAGKPTIIEMKYSANKNNEVILVFQDVSEKKNLEQLKSDFINNTTHEMRTPLTTILLMIDLMEKTEDAAKKDEYWQILKGEVLRERMLIEDLLMISRIEKGKYLSQKKSMDICASLNEAIAAIQPQADGVGLRILAKVPSHPLFITGDANSCKMIFSNLLTNAIKFSPQQGTIEVSAAQSGSSIQLVFRDHGIGIPSEDLPGIFDRFYRGKNAILDEIQGSGIGLFIVDHLTQEMGGKVDVNSQVGKGTTFTLEFPLQVPEAINN